MQIIPLLLGFVQYFISRKFDPFFPAPHIKTLQTYLISFSTTQNYAPNVAFLLVVSTNTPKSRHSKQQYFTAHNIYSCNKFILPKCNIYPSVPDLHYIYGPNLAAPAMDHITHFVQLAHSTKTTHSALSNAACLRVRYTIFWHFLDSASGTVVDIKYPGTFQIIFFHIFLQEIKSLLFFVEPSMFVHRSYFTLTEINFRVTGSTSFLPMFSIRGRKCVTDFLPLLFSVLNPEPPSRQRKKFFFQPYNMI